MPNLKITDTHAHVDMGAFDTDRSKMLERAWAAGVVCIVDPATGLKSSEEIIKLSEREPRLFAAAGFHPHDVTNVMPSDLDALAKLAIHKRVVAIGETGLDFYRNKSPRDIQLKIFDAELGLSKELKLPIIVHSREAEKETLEMLHRHFPVGSVNPHAPGVIHCFSGDSRVLKEYVDMGFYVSVGGYTTYPSSDRLYDVLREIPGDRLLLETDSPYLAPQSHRGGRNEPAYLTEVIGLLSKLRGVSPETLAEMTTENACRLFKITLP